MTEVVQSIPVNAMHIADIGGRDFYLFMDLFVHRGRQKLTAVSAYYGGDIDWAEHGVAYDAIRLEVENLSIEGKYIPHRLDSYEPAILIDFEAPGLAELIETHESLTVTVTAGAHQQTFTLDASEDSRRPVTISVIVKNENQWLPSFLEYYLGCLDVDHVYVYDNGTSDRDQLIDVMAPYVARHQATLVNWVHRWRNRSDQKQIGQPPHQAHSLNRFGDDWIGFFDVDEFLRIPDRTLPAFLSEFDPEVENGLSFGLRWFGYKGNADISDIENPLLSMMHSKRDTLGRKRQKLIVSPRNVRFLRFHWLEEDKEETVIPDDEIYFHHYYVREARFEEGKSDPELTYDPYMYRFATRFQRPMQGSQLASLGQEVGAWVDHVKRSLTLGERQDSKLNQGVLDVYGYCGLTTRHFLNNLCAFKGARYLEIGVLRGATLCAATYQNPIKATAIDNWAQFGGPRDAFFENIERFCHAELTTLEEDWQDVDFKSLGPFNVYFYDAGHREHDHVEAITRLVDFWNR